MYEVKRLTKNLKNQTNESCSFAVGSLESAESSARDSSHSTSSPGLSNDSAVESWDQNTPVRTSANCGKIQNNL